ncbi:LINE-1 retrotransposable element ORF2 protein [Vitis vinifera]|uniref:LINE-1 retrotransposable element ORF2 protein n=1 Tax=Vitis vinifera TaxID=29760 RepID=A0A438D8U3_VITVI|nr:LINE-1 retrotransposable element ORF2 protein [Vitis vinifera]
MASAHWRNNFLDRIKINGAELVEEQEVREGIVKAFKHQLREEPGWRADLEGLHLKSLDLNEAEALEVPFTEEEIFFALMDMNGDKAPGPNGFTVAFWQACWDFAKEEIVELFKEFYDQKSFAKSLNATFLVIIPKKGGAEDLGKFRPISLLGGPYKLMAKVLANRLKMVLNKKRKEKGLVCKLDIEKAYDSISWSFLMKGNFISGCRLKGRGDAEIMVSHLLFANDTILFCEASKDQLTHLGWILAWFEAASGLRINLAKSELISVGEIDNIEEMAVELGCRIRSFPVKYLGPGTRPCPRGTGWRKE